MKPPYPLEESEQDCLLVELPLPPSTNKLWATVTTKDGPRRVSTKTAREYKEDVGKRCMIARLSPFSGPVSVTLWVYFMTAAGDLDNRLKCLLDALQGWAYYDDKQVQETHIYRRVDRMSPRVVVTVELLEPLAAGHDN